MTKLTTLWSWWEKREERQLKEAFTYFKKQSKDTLLADFFSFQARLEKQSKHWELLLGLVVTLIFSDDVKRVLAFIISHISAFPYEVIQKSLLMSLAILGLILILLVSIVLTNFHHHLAFKRYQLLKYYLTKQKII